MYIEEAEKLASKCGTRNPKKIASMLQINIIRLAMREIYGIAANLGPHRFIGVNSLLDEPIQKLVIAHELGHFTLHPEGNFFFVLNKTCFYSKWEYQANLFAIGLCIGEEVARYDFIKELAAEKVEDIAKYL